MKEFVPGRSDCPVFQDRPVREYTGHTEVCIACLQLVLWTSSLQGIADPPVMIAAVPGLATGVSRHRRSQQFSS